MVEQAQQTKKGTGDNGKVKEAEGEAGVGAVFEDLGEFKSINTSTEYFYKPEVERDKGPLITIRGVPLARKKRPAKKGQAEQFYLIMRVTRDVTVFDGDKKKHAVPPGTLVWVDERAQTRMASLCLPRLEGNRATGFEVVIEPTKKKDLKGGKTMWAFNVLSKKLTSAECEKWGITAMAELFDIIKSGGGATLALPEGPTANDEDEGEDFPD